MESPRIATTLRTVRERLGWSREALAYHSGVSFAAIAQIESGRRKDVRLSSLSALADALGISVDYLIGSSAAATPPQLFDHQVFVYGSDEEFIAAAIAFLDEGIEQSHCLLAVLTKTKMGLLRDALGSRSELVEFADWADWYRSPKEALRRYGEFVKQQIEAGAGWIRVVAEAAWADSTDAKLAVWSRYEALVNLAFASSPATIMCTYDERSFPAEILAEARTTHPQLAYGNHITPSPSYRKPEDVLLDAQ
jgi:transcriptional regulator with XRE-family HTH domain